MAYYKALSVNERCSDKYDFYRCYIVKALNIKTGKLEILGFYHWDYPEYMDKRYSGDYDKIIAGDYFKVKVKEHCENDNIIHTFEITIIENKDTIKNLMPKLKEEEYIMKTKEFNNQFWKYFINNKRQMFLEEWRKELSKEFTEEKNNIRSFIRYLNWDNFGEGDTMAVVTCDDYAGYSNTEQPSFDDFMYKGHHKYKYRDRYRY